MRLFWGILAAVIVSTGSGALAVIAGPETTTDSAVLVPHRAVYEITLADKSQAVSVSAVRGRMVFEITGSPCEGYTQNMRMITRTTDERGKSSLSDIRSSTWEQGNGHRLRFSSSQYLDQQLQEVVAGAATRVRKAQRIRVEITKPGAATLELPGDALFPTQHSLALIRAARAGKRNLNVRVFDGSEQGQGFYRTYSYIGTKVPAVVAGAKPGKVRKARESRKNMIRLGLARMPSWPVAVSYFNGEGNSDDSAPSYELSFRLYPNGVSRDLLINYGTFSVRGRLSQIKYLHTGPCRHKRKH